MAKIEELTPEDAALIPIVREEWRKISLATGPADREVAQAAIADAYRQAGLDPPERWIWFGSPWAGCIGAWMLMQSPITMNSVWYEVRHKVSDPAWIQVQAQGLGSSLDSGSGSSRGASPGSGWDSGLRSGRVSGRAASRGSGPRGDRGSALD